MGMRVHPVQFYWIRRCKSIEQKYIQYFRCGSNTFGWHRVIGSSNPGHDGTILYAVKAGCHDYLKIKMSRFRVHCRYGTLKIPFCSMVTNAAVISSPQSAKDFEKNPKHYSSEQQGSSKWFIIHVVSFSLSLFSFFSLSQLKIKYLIMNIFQPAFKDYNWCNNIWSKYFGSLRV